MARPRRGLPPPRVLRGRGARRTRRRKSGSSRRRPSPARPDAFRAARDPRGHPLHHRPRLARRRAGVPDRARPQPERRRSASVVLELPLRGGPLRRGARADRAGARSSTRSTPSSRWTRGSRATSAETLGGRRGGDPPRDRDGSPQALSRLWVSLPASRAAALRRRARRTAQGARAPAGLAGADRVLGLRERARRPARGRRGRAARPRRPREGALRRRLPVRDPDARDRRSGTSRSAGSRNPSPTASGRLAYLGVERGFDPLRNEPRFAEVVRRLGIPKPR